MVASRGETVTTVPVGIETFKGRFRFPPAVSEMLSVPENAPTVGDVNSIVTEQLPEPATGPVQVSAVLLKVPDPVRVAVGVTEPVPILVAVKTLVIGVEMVVVAVHDVGEMESGIRVGSPVTVAVAVPVDPPFTAVAVIVQVPFVEGAV